MLDNRDKWGMETKLDTMLTRLNSLINQIDEEIDADDPDYDAMWEMADCLREAYSQIENAVAACQAARECGEE